MEPCEMHRAGMSALIVASIDPLKLQTILYIVDAFNEDSIPTQHTE